jgi:chromosome segregation ATPase
MKLSLFTYLTRVRTSLLSFIWTVFNFETELLIYPGTVKRSGETRQSAQKLSASYPAQGQPQHGILSSSDVGAGKEIARLEGGRLVELERQLSETLVAKTERDQRIAQLTDELARKSVLLEQAAEEKKRAGLELRELQAKLDESLLSRDHALEQVQSALHKASCAAEANEQSQRELAEVHAKLEAGESELAAFRLRLADTENSSAKSKAEADTGLRELQAKLDKSLQSRDHAVEQVQNALQKASCAAEANEQSQRELAEVHSKLEARESELAAFRLRLADTENGCAKGKAEANTYRNQGATDLVNTDEVRVVHRLMERVQAMEAEMASLRGNEKSFEMMECRNEG